jgi:hypothetical protein
MKAMSLERQFAFVFSGLASLSNIIPLIMAEAPAQWRLHAAIPAICSVTSVTQDSTDPRKLAVETHCNLQRYAVALDVSPVETGRAAKIERAHVSGGQAVIATGRIEITASRPGTAKIELELAEAPAAGRLSATIVPVR